MAARKSKKQINLLPQKGLTTSTAGRILFWILSTFRIIVIVTEILVMVAFLSRFWLDAQNSDLNDELKQKQAVLASLTSFEEKFRDTQKRIEVYANYANNNFVASTWSQDIVSSQPPDITLNTITFDPETVSLDGISVSEQSIQQFVINLQAKNSFEAVQITEIRSDPESGLLTFKLIITTKAKS